MLANESEHKISIERIYESYEDGNEYRILVDRLWPRGVSKDKARLDEWAKEVTPSPELRVWFGHKPENFETFTNRYMTELDNSTEAHDWVEHCRSILNHDNIVLLYGAKSPTCNHALVLKQWLDAELNNTHANEQQGE